MIDSQMILFLQQIVQRASLSGQEQAVIERAADEMRALGFDRVYTDRAGSLIGSSDGAAPGLTLLLDAHCDTVDLPPALGAYRFCSNAAVSAGVRGVPTVGFGPMTEEMAHIVDEYLDLEALAAAARGYASIIQHVLRPQ